MPQLILEIQDMKAPGVKAEVSKTFGEMQKFPKEISARGIPSLGPKFPRPRIGIRTGQCPYLKGL